MSFSDVAARLSAARSQKDQPDQEAARPPDRPVDFAELYALRARILGVLIRDARLAKGRSVAQCAAAVGVPPETFNVWELGEATPSLPQLEILAYHLGVPVSQFWATETMSGNGKADALHQDEFLTLRDRVIGALLQKARAEAHLTREALAEQCGIPAEKIAAYELGQQPVPLTELTALSAVTQVSLRYFLDDASRVGQWLDLQERFKRFGQIPDDMREFVSNPINASFIALAMWLSKLEVGELRGIAESILNLTRLETADLQAIAEDILDITL